MRGHATDGDGIKDVAEITRLASYESKMTLLRAGLDTGDGRQRVRDDPYCLLMSWRKGRFAAKSGRST